MEKRPGPDFGDIEASDAIGQLTEAVARLAFASHLTLWKKGLLSKDETVEALRYAANVVDPSPENQMLMCLSVARKLDDYARILSDMPDEPGPHLSVILGGKTD